MMEVNGVVNPDVKRSGRQGKRPIAADELTHTVGVKLTERDMEILAALMSETGGNSASGAIRYALRQTAKQLGFVTGDRG